MGDVTEVLFEIESGDPAAAEQLLPLVYDELRKLAAIRLAQEKAGQTLQATAVVHEAYVRLVDTDRVQDWNSRGHFFAAAAEAMRRILIENARRKSRQKHGGSFRRIDFENADVVGELSPCELLSLDDAMEKLAAEDSTAASLVKLKFFAGQSIEEAARAIGISKSAAYRHWTYARAWLFTELCDQ